MTSHRQHKGPSRSPIVASGGGAASPVRACVGFDPDNDDEYETVGTICGAVMNFAFNAGVFNSPVDDEISGAVIGPDGVILGQCT